MQANQKVGVQRILEIPSGAMNPNRYVPHLLSSLVLAWCAACNHSSASPIGPGIAVNLTGSFATIEAGGVPATLVATVAGQSTDAGVTWTLSVANTDCSPGCGTLKVTSTVAPNYSAVYTPPGAPPGNSVATITVRSQ